MEEMEKKFQNNIIVDGGGSGKSYIKNITQSSTGNVYGIYDLCKMTKFEYVVAFNSIDSNEYLLSSNWTEYTGLTVNSNSTKYATRYNNTVTDNNKNMYESGIIGDATKEIYYSRTDTQNAFTWFDNLSNMFRAIEPFMYRWQKNSLVFATSTGCEKGNFMNRFRTVLCP